MNKISQALGLIGAQTLFSGEQTLLSGEQAGTWVPVEDMETKIPWCDFPVPKSMREGKTFNEVQELRKALWEKQQWSSK
jgi:hypothetical protein